MNKQQKQAAKEAMIEWLVNPSELGKRPSAIKCVETFDLHGMKYYIFKYKKSPLGKWVLGVSGGYEADSMNNCGHIFSKMRAYNPNTAKQESIEMVELIREYWIKQAEGYANNIYSDFPFRESRNVATITCKHIMNEHYPILYVSHDSEDGMWQFLCGNVDELDDAMVVALEEVYAKDTSIAAIANLPLGAVAYRSNKESAWTIKSDT